MCSGPPTIYQTSPLMSKHGNWVPLLMILAANTSVDRKSLGSSAHCHKKVSSRRLYGSRRCFLANWYPQEEHCSIWCNPVQRSWLQKTQFLHCDHVIVLYFRFKHGFFSYVSEDLWMHCLTLSVQTLQLHKWSIHEETLMVTVHSRAVAHNKPEGNVALSLPSHLCYLPRITLRARCVTLHRAPSAFTYTAAVATHH